MSVFLWFGLGFGLPLLIMSFLAGGLQRQITQMLARHARVINLDRGSDAGGDRPLRRDNQLGFDQHAVWLKAELPDR